MKKKLKKTSYLLISVLPVVLVLAFIYIWYSQQKITLIKLQKAILVTKTDSERQKILDRLDKYYLTMSIPDSIQQRVQAEVDSLIKQQEHSEWDTNFTVLDTNVYVLENQLREVLRDAMIAHVRGDKPMLQALMQP